jgi:hypothetical protein
VPSGKRDHQREDYHTPYTLVRGGVHRRMGRVAFSNAGAGHRPDAGGCSYRARWSNEFVLSPTAPVSHTRRLAARRSCGTDTLGLFP